MPNWTGNTVPNYYKDLGDERIDEKPYHSNDAGSLFQTDRGWEREIVYTDQHGRERVKRYVVVADRERQTDVSHINITDVRVGNAVDYSTTEPTVAGSTAGDSFDITITFNQAVALSADVDLIVLGGTTPLLTPTYKSGNMTSQITWSVDTSSETTADELLLSTATSGAGQIVAWDRSANVVHPNGLTIPVAANVALYGATVDTITGSGNHGLANTVIE